MASPTSLEGLSILREEKHHQTGKSELVNRRFLDGHEPVEQGTSVVERFTEHPRRMAFPIVSVPEDAEYRRRNSVKRWPAALEREQSFCILGSVPWCHVWKFCQHLGGGVDLSSTRHV